MPTTLASMGECVGVLGPATSAGVGRMQKVRDVRL